MKILISDTHFGCRQNSITWLDSQMKFFYDQLIPFIKQQKEPVYLYHLGDVFDIRSTVNLLVANKVHKLFEDLLDVCTGVVVIGGNHDYYSPEEHEDNTNSIRLVLGDLENTHKNLYLFDREMGLLHDFEDLFVPWFRYFDFERLKDVLNSEPTIKRIFIHSDLTVTLEDRYRELFKNHDVYSGHIHTPKHENNLHTLGSTFALTFADCNSDRGFYTMNDDGSDLQFHANKESIRFFRLYNRDLFKDNDIRKEDYVELYVDQGNLLKESYVEKIKLMTKKISNFVTIPHNDIRLEDDSTDFERYDIADICRQNIPENLIEKFNKISSTQEEVSE